jgi:hypothetical protein
MLNVPLVEATIANKLLIKNHSESEYENFLAVPVLSWSVLFGGSYPK